MTQEDEFDLDDEEAVTLATITTKTLQYEFNRGFYAALTSMKIRTSSLIEKITGSKFKDFQDNKRRLKEYLHEIESEIKSFEQSKEKQSEL